MIQGNVEENGGYLLYQFARIPVLLVRQTRSDNHGPVRPKQIVDSCIPAVKSSGVKSCRLPPPNRLSKLKENQDSCVPHVHLKLKKVCSRFRVNLHMYKPYYCFSE